jgi:hypothetical protein
MSLLIADDAGIGWEVIDGEIIKLEPKPIQEESVEEIND